MPEESLASEKQRNFAKKLGLDIPASATMQEASRLIDEAVKKQRKEDEKVAGTFSKPQGNSASKTAQPKLYSKPLYNGDGRQASIEKMHEEKTKRMIEEEKLKIRTMAISFSKDLVVAGKTNLADMESMAEKITGFINKTTEKE